MAKITDDKTQFASGRHYNGSKWVELPNGIFWSKKTRSYVDENNKSTSWNPNFPEENLPVKSKPAKEAEEKKAPAGKGK